MIYCQKPTSGGNTEYKPQLIFPQEKKKVERVSSMAVAPTNKDVNTMKGGGGLGVQT